jgi:hypothetical protein
MQLSGCLRLRGFGTWGWGGVQGVRGVRGGRGSNGVMLWKKRIVAFLARLRPSKRSTLCEHLPLLELLQLLELLELLCLL